VTRQIWDQLGKIYDKVEGTSIPYHQNNSSVGKDLRTDGGMCGGNFPGGIGLDRIM